MEHMPCWSVWWFALIAGSSACDFERDSVGPGYGQAGTSGSCPLQPSTPLPGAPDREQAGSAGSPNGQRSSQPPERGAIAAAGSGGAPPATGSAAECDLFGRWLITTHTVTDALGQLQVAHYYFYYELEQSGTAVTVRKGLMCGTDARGLGDFAVTADFSGSRDATMRKLSFAGKRGTAKKTAVGCRVEFEKLYIVMGASIPHYLNPANALPTAADAASGTTPGWEDWDEDGRPGVTGVITGVVSGKVFAAPRNWLLIAGEVPSVAKSFRMPLDWNAEPNVMAFDGTPLLATEAVRAADRARHYIEFARLASDQATGDDEAVCASTRQLAKTLTPAAAGL